MGSRAAAQTPISPDPQVRVTQQWEDVLLLEAFEYLQLTPDQSKAMQVLADYSRSRMDEIDQKKARLQKAVQDQHQSILKGKHPTGADQLDVLQKQREVQDRQEIISKEIVDRVTPKLAAILTRKQTVRAWRLTQNKIPPAEPKRVALTDPSSGFVYPQMEGKDVIEDMVKTTLRQTYGQDVIDQALLPWELASLGALAGGGIPGLGGGGGGAAGGGAAGGARAIQAIQDMDPRMGERMLTLGQRMLKQFGGGGQNPGGAPPVAPDVRNAINKDAAAIRKSIEDDPESYLSQAHGNQPIDALRPLARRLFLSPRIKDALAATAVR